MRARAVQLGRLVASITAGWLTACGGGQDAGVTRTVEPPATTSVTVASITPDTIRASSRIVITGTGFSANLFADTVLVDGIPGNIVEAADTQLVVIAPPALPCSASDSGSITVSVPQAARVVVAHPTAAASLRTLAVGQAVLLSSAEAACTALTGGGASYAINVYNAHGDAFPQSAAFVVAGSGGGASLSELARTAVSLAAAQRTALPANGPAFDAIEEFFNHRSDVNALAAGDAFVRAHPHLLGAMSAYHRHAVRSSRSTSARSVAVVPPQVGSYRQIALPIPSCISPTIIQARVAAVSKRAVVYEDTAQGWAGRADTVLAKIAQLVDQGIYPSDSANFSDPLLTDSLTDHDGRIGIVFSDHVELAGDLGFVSPCDFTPPDGATSGTSAGNATGNFGEYVYSAYLPASYPNAAAALLQQQPMVIAHEMKHLAAYEWRVTHSAPLETQWLEEGLAEHAEELWARNYVYHVPWKGNTGYQASLFCDLHLSAPGCAGVQGLTEEVYQLYHFLDSTDVHSPVGTTIANDATSYNSSWSLVRWAIDRYAANEGASLRSLVQSFNFGMANLSAVTGQPADQLLGYWSLAMMLDDTPATAKNPDLNIATWNLYDILSNVRHDASATIPLFFSGLATAPAVRQESGSFALSHAGLWGGGFLPLRVTAPANATSIIIGLAGSSPGTLAPGELRIAVARVK